MKRIAWVAPRSSGSVVTTLTPNDLARFRYGLKAMLGGFDDADDVAAAWTWHTVAAPPGPDPSILERKSEARDDVIRHYKAGRVTVPAVNAANAIVRKAQADLDAATAAHAGHPSDADVRAFFMAGLGRIADAPHPSMRFLPRSVWDWFGHLHPGAQGLRGVHVCSGDDRGPGCWMVFRQKNAPTRCPACKLKANKDSEVKPRPLVLDPRPGDLQADGETPWWLSRWDRESRELRYVRTCDEQGCEVAWFSDTRAVHPAGRYCAAHGEGAARTRRSRAA